MNVVAVTLPVYFICHVVERVSSVVEVERVSSVVEVESLFILVVEVESLLSTVQLMVYAVELR